MMASAIGVMVLTVVSSIGMSAGASQGIALGDVCLAMDRDVMCRKALSVTGNATAGDASEPCENMGLPNDGYYPECIAMSGTGNAACESRSYNEYLGVIEERPCLAASVTGDASTNPEGDGSGTAVSVTGRAEGTTAISACNFWTVACISP